MTVRTFSRVSMRTLLDFALFLRPMSSSTLKAYFESACKGGIVLKSASTDIFQNLALEDWIHEHIDVQERSVLLLWRNSPAVVIGRHQNAWQECNLSLMRSMGIPLARRRSGGGTVFHDLGNINLTFFTSKKKYDRHRNLRVVTGALKDLRPDLDVSATDRFDIVLNGIYKISGTAAKLGRTAAYHHCTLLCSSDRSLLSSVLQSNCKGIKSNATPSVPSPVKNLQDEDPSLDLSAIMGAIASRYSAEFGFDSPVITVDPSVEQLMPGIHKMAADLQAWEWVYGRTPKFSICTSFTAEGANIGLDMDIKNGVVEKCAMDIPHHWLPPEVGKELCSALTGIRFCPSEVAVVVAAFMRTVSQAPDLARKTQSVYENVVAVM
ncbi:lipoyltransferase 1, mitochondrial [Colossoma macropomum]|uniref:lipoyltransferase 1, mitochondrial n=1 Tax=Colossoma macropomum TaxID=42526 RepID=UPI0018646095|nr:lipoyltransferase 1, mitochondrial [Colossoma macropomum]